MLRLWQYIKHANQEIFFITVGCRGGMMFRQFFDINDDAVPDFRHSFYRKIGSGIGGGGIQHNYGSSVLL
ncbi:hypothetical protein AV650_17140 [Serratia fonticola]|nr:hypothetical protein AV650_17140 [Serratia fonticola]